MSVSHVKVRAIKKVVTEDIGGIDNKGRGMCAFEFFILNISSSAPLLIFVSFSKHETSRAIVAERVVWNLSLALQKEKTMLAEYTATMKKQHVASAALRGDFRLVHAQKKKDRPESNDVFLKGLLSRLSHNRLLVAM